MSGKSKNMGEHANVRDGYDFTYVRKEEGVERAKAFPAGRTNSPQNGSDADDWPQKRSLTR